MFGPNLRARASDPHQQGRDPTRPGRSTLWRKQTRWKTRVMDSTKRFERLFLATDGSQASQAAVEAAIAIAKSPTVKVKVAHVWNLEVHHRHGHWDVEMRSEAEKLVDATVMRLFKAGVIAERQIIRADSNLVAAAIALEAKEFGADLVVIGSRGLSDWQSLTRHSVSHQLLSAVDCPVLIAREQKAGLPDRASKILLAIAGGDDLAPGARAVMAIAQPGASVMVVHVALAIFGMQGFAYVESQDEIHETMARACELLGKAGVEVQGLVAHQGPVAKAVAEIAEDWNADLIVIGSSRMRDIGSLFLGSVSHDLLHMTDRPVLIAERVTA
jgi:nucleotide-binding universal stress UspA family protein